MSIVSSRRGWVVGLAWLLATGCFDVACTRAQVYLNLVIDPSIAAFSGIPAAGGFSGNSTRSGPGTWQLFALDDSPASYGLSTFGVSISNATNLTNLAPTATWYEDSTFSDGPYYAGFTDRFTTSNAIAGIQNQIYQPVLGMGQQAGNFNDVLHRTVYYTTSPPFPTISGQWGNYATIAPFHGKNWLLLGEGTYLGTKPTIDLASTTAKHYTNQSGTDEFAAVQLFPVPEPSALPLIGIALAVYTRCRRTRRVTCRGCSIQLT